MTLTIANGLIQDDFLGDVPILKRIVTSQGGANNVRTHLPLEGPIGVTIHNTGNSDPSADALAHAGWLANVEAQDALYIGAHFFVSSKPFLLMKSAGTPGMVWAKATPPPSALKSVKLHPMSVRKPMPWRWRQR